MEADLLRLFQREVAQQARFALIANRDLVEALREMNQPPPPGEMPDAVSRRDLMDRIWATAQAFLTAVANVSKLLWGINKNVAARRTPLRESLEIADDSPLRPRDLRDRFEHFDERLETWGEERHGHYVDRNIGPRDKMISGLDPDTVLRHLDPEAGEISFRGERFEIRPIVNALVPLVEKAESESGLPW